MSKDSTTRHRLGARPVGGNVVAMPGATATPPGDGELDNRPTIMLEPGQFHKSVAESEAALLASGLPIYQRDNRLVQVIGLDKDVKAKGLFRPAGAPQIVPVETSHLVSMLSSAAQYYKLRRSSDPEQKYAPADPPARLADAMLANPEPKAPPLVGFIEAPLVGPDGKIYDRPGYIEESGLLLTAVPVNWSRPKHHLNQADAASAVNRVLELFETFPFEADCDRSAAVALVMTALLRRVMAAAPIFGIAAPAPGTGKSLFVDVISIIATGRPAAVMSMGEDAAETEKRLGSVLIAGDGIVAVDNVSKPFKSDLLCSMATQLEVSIRVLGVSKRAKITTRVTITLTGNNLTPRGDLVRRVVPIRLNAKCEKPEDRVFDSDPKDTALRHRASLVAAALAITAAYLRCGEPKVDAKPYGSFGEWDRMVRRPLIFAGLPDPLAAVSSLRASDPDVEAHGAVLQAWHATFGHADMTAHGVIAEANNRELSPSGEPGRWVNLGLHEALSLAVAQRNGQMNSRGLGYWLRAHKDRPMGGLILRHVGERQGVSLWSVQAQ